MVWLGAGRACTTAVWVLAVCCVALGARGVRAQADPGMAMNTDNLCRELATLATRPDVFRFDGMENWVNGTDCCLWPGVTCELCYYCTGHVMLEHLMLEKVHGNGSFASISTPTSRIVVTLAADSELVALPRWEHCGTTFGACFDALMVSGPVLGDKLPLLRPESLSVVHDHTVESISLRHVRVDTLDTRLWSGKYIKRQTISLHHVVSSSEDLVFHSSVSELSNVIGMKRIITVRDDHTMPVFAGVLSITDCPDLEEMEAHWTAAGDFTLRDCPQLVKGPETINGHQTAVTMQHLPRLVALPGVSTAVHTVHFEALPPSLFTPDAFRGVLPLGEDVAWAELYIIDCGLEELGEVPSTLTKLDLSSNKLRALPAVLSNHTRDFELVVDDNPISALPLTTSSLAAVRCRNCSLSGGMDLSEVRLTKVDLSGNNITEIWFAGTEQAILVANNMITQMHFPNDELPTQLQELDAAHNQLVSVVGDQPFLGALPLMLQFVDLSHNKLEGTLARFPFPPALTMLNLSHNNLEAVPRFGTGVFENVWQLTDAFAHQWLESSSSSEMSIEMQVLDLSYNKLKTLHVADMAPDAGNYLHYLNVAHNQLEDWEPLRKLIHNANELVWVRANDNRLAVHRDDVPFWSSSSDSFTDLDLRNNNFTGTFPDIVHQMPGLLMASLENSGFHMRPTPACHADPRAEGCLGAVVVGEMVSSGHDLCPALLLPTEGGNLDTGLTPAYYDRKLCQCAFGYYAEERGGTCQLAPSEAICPGGVHSQTVLARKGHWLSEGVCIDTGAHMAQRCTREFYAQCAPNNTVVSVVEGDATPQFHPDCASGFTGRMCSACADGFYRWGSECRECPVQATSEGVAAVGIIVLLCVCLASAYLLTPSSDAAFKVAVFAVQTVAVLGSVNVSFAPFLNDFLQLWGVFFMEVPFLNGCLTAHGAFVQLEGTFVLFALVFGVPLFVWVLGAVWIKVRRLDGSVFTSWARRSVRALAVLYWMGFQRFVVVLPAYFQCSDDTCTGDSFFRRFPFESCSGHGRSMMLTSITMFVLVFVPLPLAAIAWAVRRHRARQELWGLDFFVNGYKDDFAWWDAVTLAAKVLIGLFAGLVTADRVFSAFFVAVVLLFLFVGHIKLAPFEQRSSNGASTAVLLVEAIVFVAAVASNASSLSASGAFGGLLVFVQTAVLGLAVMLVLGVQISEQTSKRVERMMGGWWAPVDEGL